MTISAEVTKPLINKKVDQFYVKFYGLSENDGNILGRQVKSIERPTINFNSHEVFNKGVKRSGNDYIDFQPITITFMDDDTSLTIKALYDQIKRQNGSLSPNFDNAEFEIKIDIYNSADKIVESLTLEKCFIMNLSHSEQIYSDSADNLITATIAINGLCYDFPELDQ